MPCGHPHVDANNVEKLVEKGLPLADAGALAILRRARQGIAGKRAEIGGPRHDRSAGSWAPWRAGSPRRACYGSRSRDPDVGQRPRAAASDAADENFRIEHEIGQALPCRPRQPAAADRDRPPTMDRRLVPYAGQVPTVPPGFTATLFTAEIANPRRLLVLPNGDIIVAQQNVGRVTAVARRRHRACGARRSYVDGFKGPYGLAWRDNELLVTDLAGIWRVRPGAEAEPLTPSGVFGAIAGHNNRPIAIDPKDGRAVRRGRLDEQYRGRARAEGHDPALRRRRQSGDFCCGTRNPTTLPSTRRPAICGPGCRNATASATTCPPIT